VVVQIADDVPAEYRDAIQASVTTLARRSAEASRRAFERSKARYEALTAINRPLLRMLEEDADASQALAAAGRRLEEFRSDPPTQEPAWPTVKLVDGRSRAADATGFLADQVFVSPWHYRWDWWKGAPPTLSVPVQPTGRITVQNWASSHSDRPWADAHAGFGIALRPTQHQAVVARSLRRTEHEYRVDSDSTGSATVEGGIEMTLLDPDLPEPDRLLSLAKDKRFRKRVSGWESDSVDPDGWTTGDGGIQVSWVMQPGRVYTINVGAWVFCEAHGGALPHHSSTAWARLNAEVISITADFTD
jgi:hypothetical protein